MEKVKLLINVFNGHDTVRSMVLEFDSEIDALEAQKIAFEAAAPLEPDDL